MPTLTNLEGLALHSPSTQIVGTPFDSSSKFEYPVSSAESTSSHASPLTFPILLSGGSFPFFSASSSAQLTLLSLIHSEVSSSSSSSSTSSTSSFTPVHPKLKPSANPPIPPSLVKKRARWSLGKGRRKNSFEGQDETFLEEALRGEHDGVLLPRDEGGRAKH